VLENKILRRMSNAYGVLVGKQPVAKMPVGRSKHRWENIKMVLKEIRCKYKYVE
jgi:hypothetical protein